MLDTEKKKSFAMKYYGFIVLILLCLFLSIVVVILGENLYATINDNLDSNVVQYKMAKENGAFNDNTVELPLLGGQSNLSIGLTISKLPYYLFSPLIAYYFVFIAKVFLAGSGFFFLAQGVNKYSNFTLDSNVFCLCGTAYGLLGSWPNASLSFALLPWWILTFYLLYKSKKKVFVVIPLLLVREVSFPVLGVFALFYTVVVFILVCVLDRKVHIKFLIGLLALMSGYYFLARGAIFSGISGSTETVKSLASVKYTDSIRQSLTIFLDKFLFDHLYHTGGADLVLFVMPICTLFFFLHIGYLVKRKKQRNLTISKIYIFFYLAIILNTFACAFDNNFRFRSIFSFTSGFSFSRFSWLSPCMWMILFAIVCCEIKYSFLRYGSILVAFLLIIFCPGYKALNSMYNEVYYNVSAAFDKSSFSKNNMIWTWKEFYSEELFERIKKDIVYNGEWAAAYGVDSAVLQYNGIKTLDGYYSNYSLEYHNTFERMIRSELDVDEHHRMYWESSYGIRAYLYSPNWDFIMPKNSDILEDHLYIDSDVFYEELGGRLIFSRVIISNADELGFVLEGEWSDEESPYTIYVYSITEESIAGAKARKAYKLLDSSLSYLKNYDSANLLHNDKVFVESNHMIIDSDGVVFGPAEPIEVGTYNISFYGSNLDECICDAFANSNWYAVQYSEEYRNSGEVRLKLHIIEPVQDIEFRVFNYSNKQAYLHCILVEKEGLTGEQEEEFHLEDNRIEISPDLIDRYRMTNGRGNISDGIEDVKVLILERESLEKGFENYNDRNSLLNNCIANGSEKAWICASAMEKLPKQYRADSLDNATILVILEREYYISGYAVRESKTLKGTGEHHSVEYYPKYDLLSYLNIYNAKTGLYETREHKKAAAPVLVTDMDSAYIWSSMAKLERLNLLLCGGNEADVEEIGAVLAELDRGQLFLCDFISFWKECVSNSDSYLAAASVEDVYWQLAKLLKELNKDTAYTTQFETAQFNRDKEALKKIVDEIGIMGLEDIVTFVPSEDYWHSFSIEMEVTDLGEHSWYVRSTKHINFELASYPEIANLWEKILSIYSLAAYVERNYDNLDLEYAHKEMEKLGELDKELASKIQLWDKCIELDQYNALIASMYEKLWNYAEQIKEVDENYYHRKAIQEAIDMQSFERLAELVKEYGYTTIDFSVERVKSDKLYLAQTDNNWIIEMLTRVVSSFIEQQDVTE